jgi:hypothetical protein
VFYRDAKGRAARKVVYNAVRGPALPYPFGVPDTVAQPGSDSGVELQ